MIEGERTNKITDLSLNKNIELQFLQFVSKFLIIYKITDSFFYNKKCLLN